ncbi:MAG TPA: hypothetical protein VKP04_03160 [Ktedonobacteraceae bacterium]|nr:hypothetical protein [Ktedonobacteraceae bacterium]
MAGSEIARILQRIRDEEESAQRALFDPAIVSRHQFITKRSENIGQHVLALAEAVGSDQEAMKLYIAVQEQVEREVTGGVETARYGVALTGKGVLDTIHPQTLVPSSQPQQQEGIL